MKRYEFICKGKRTHTIDALDEASARSFFAENRYTAALEIIDVIEKDLPTPIVNNVNGNVSLEGHVHTQADITVTAEQAAPGANSERVGF